MNVSLLLWSINPRYASVLCLQIELAAVIFFGIALLIQALTVL
jgi:hypothetical protein